MQIDTVIKNCKVVNHDGIIEAGVAINGGKIVAVAKDGELPQAVSTIDANGKYLIPGLVDAHFHLEYPPGVDPQLNIRQETLACAAAGCTTVVHLLAPADNILERARSFIALYEENAFVDLALSARMYTADNVKEISSLYDSGIVAFKLLLPYKGSEAVWSGRKSGVDDDIVELTFKEVARLNAEGKKAFVRVHCEDADLVLRFKDEFLEKGGVPKSWDEVRPRICEEESMRRCLKLAGDTGCPLYIVHMTIKEGIALIQKARAEGVDVVAETCVQYLTLNTGNTDPVLSKINPPLREAEDNAELWKALREGSIDVVATDHAPVPKALKKTFWEALVGMPGAETFLPVMLSEGVNAGRISLERLVDLCCYRPAKEFGLLPRKGVICEGADADLVLIDLEKELPSPSEPLYSAADYSLFGGRMIRGQPVMTMVGGNTVMQDGRIVTQVCNGKFVPAS